MTIVKGLMMKNMIYNDMEFSIDKASRGWDIRRKLAGGEYAFVGAALFEELPDDEAEKQFQLLVQTIYPVGIKIIGPDVTHPNRVGDLRIVGPDVAHPNFVYWKKDSSSFKK